MKTHVSQKDAWSFLDLRLTIAIKLEWVCIKYMKIEEISKKKTYTKNTALEGILIHCVVWCLAAFYGLSLFNFHWIGSAWRFLPPLYSLHSKEVEKSFEF